MKVLAPSFSLLLLSIGKICAFSSAISNLRSYSLLADSHAVMRGGNVRVCCNNRPANVRALKVIMNADSAEKSGIDDWITQSSIKAQQLENAKSLRVDMFTSEYASLKGQAGNVIDPSSLRGKSVALYFASASCDQCTEFTASLKAYYDAHMSQQGSGEPKLSVVFISSDATEPAALQHFHSMHPDWLMLDFSSDLRQELKRRYGVWAGAEAAAFGVSIAALRERRGGVPAVCVVDSDGALLEHLDAEALGTPALLGWVPRHQAWPH